MEFYSMSSGDDGEDLSVRPSEELVKEVYAHFGLCMFLSQVFETGLINILSALDVAKIPNRNWDLFDEQYKVHEGKSFGNLARAVKNHSFLPEKLYEEIDSVKKERDYLAHRFFRDFDLDFMTVGGCLRMIEFLEIRREKFISVDKLVSEFQTPAFSRLGVDPKQFEKLLQEGIEKMHDEARSRYSSNSSESSTIEET